MMETYHGQVRTPMDAIILFEACQQGILPRVQRRLSEKERQSIQSGSIFVWDEREAGMRRWTDGKSWSASRVSGSFLTYREMEGKRGGAASFPPVPPAVTSRNGKSPENGTDSDSDGEEDGPDGYRYKPDGLIKQSFSITTSTNQKLHLISYFSRSHPNSSEMRQPSLDPQLKHIIPRPGIYPEQTMGDPGVQTGPPVPVTLQQSARGSIVPPLFPPAQVPIQPPNIPPEYHMGQLGHAHPVQGFSPIPPQMPPQVPYGWPPSPISTPPTNYPQTAPYVASPSLPLPHSAPPTAGIGAPPKGLYDQPPASTGPGYASIGAAVHYDQPHPTLQPLQSPIPHRPSISSSISSPLPHLHQTQTSPSVSHFHQGPLPLLPPDNTRYSSPAYSASGIPYGSRTSPRPSETWEPNPTFQPPEASASPAAASLDVQDIPNEKLGFGEDARALRQLDKAFTMR